MTKYTEDIEMYRSNMDSCWDAGDTPDLLRVAEGMDKEIERLTTERTKWIKKKTRADVDNLTLSAANKDLGKQLQNVEAALNSETSKRLTLTAEGTVKDQIIAEFTELIGESHGVDGLHLNGDTVDWNWLMNNQWLEKYMDWATASGGPDAAEKGQ